MAKFKDAVKAVKNVAGAVKTGYKAGKAGFGPKTVAANSGKVASAASRAGGAVRKAVGVAGRVKGGYKAAKAGANSKHMTDKVAKVGAYTQKGVEKVKKFAGTKGGKAAIGVAAGAAVAAGGYAAYKAMKNRKKKMK